MNPESTNWTVPRLLQLSGGYWATCALHAAVRLDVFTPLAERPHSAADLATRLRLDPRGAVRLLEALVALGLATRDGDTWSATQFAARHLARPSSGEMSPEYLSPDYLSPDYLSPVYLSPVYLSPDYLGHIIRHHHLLMEGWTRLHEAVADGAPVRERSSHADGEEARESFLMGMYNLASQLGPRIAAAVDLGGRRRLLDLGGGPGTYAIHFCRANAGLTAVVCDLPTTRAFAERTIAAHGLADRISFVAADYETEPVPGRFDVAWLSHVLHGESPSGAAELLRKAAGALQPGGLLLVQEFILDDSRDGPLFPALFSLNMLVGTPGGQAYSGAELVGMMEAAGATGARRLALDLPNGAGVMVATVGRSAEPAPADLTAP